MRTIRTLLVLLALALAGRAEAQSGFVVVVHESNPMTSISRDELSKVFLKKITVWRTKRPVVVVDQADKSPVRLQFTRTVHRRELSSVQSYWQQQIFAGRAVPPQVRASDAEVVSFVAGNPSAVGYVSTSAPLPAGVKALTVQ